MAEQVQFNGTVEEIENTSRKVTVIDKDATDVQYPSAKAVKDYVAYFTTENDIVADYIVEQGTYSPKYYANNDHNLENGTIQSNFTWYYRKWNSGIAEIWGTAYLGYGTNATTKYDGGGYLGVNFHRFLYPFNLIDETECINVTPFYGPTNFDLIVRQYQTGTDYCTPSYYPRVATSMTNLNASFKISYKITGRWK